MTTTISDVSVSDSSLSNQSTLQGSVRLNDNWRFRQVGRDAMPEHRRIEWLPAVVPGSVHLDLMRSGVIPDPFVRMHERDVEWVDNADWEYETRFELQAVDHASYALKFHGLDTIAEIEFNGTPLGATDNMFVSHRFDVTGILKTGENILRVVLRSALRTGLERLAAFDREHGKVMPDHWDWWASRSFVRKAQYMYGWDWGPVLIGAGIWKDVELVRVPTAELVDWKCEYRFEGEAVVIRISADVSRSADGPEAVLRANIAGQGASIAHETAVQAGQGVHHVEFSEIRLTPNIWQPNGSGAQPLYNVDLTLIDTVTSQEIDRLTSRVGFRELELVQAPDSDGNGTGFAFRVNGHNLFIKGANWIPNDSFPARISDESVRERLTQARDAGFNMVRIWGGGFYESDYFYDVCDELGLLVWQDFPYACAYYPDNAEFIESARLEATAGVRRIRHHASIALWCGNNENHVMYQDAWGGIRPDRYLGDRLYSDVLSAVVEAENPSTPYWPSSPFGGDDHNSQDYGDCHNWDVWHGRGDWIHYVENNSRFCSEFGFASSCGLAAWDAVLDPADRYSRSPVVMWHDKTRKGYETYLGYVAKHFPDPQTMDDLVYFSQINQAEALKFGVEHYRRNKGRCWGTLFWQLNDCWPVQSWAVIDSLGEQKAAYYACKKFYAPVLLSLVRSGNQVEIHLTNDLLDTLAGEVEFELASYSGQTLRTERFAVSIDGNSSALVKKVKVDDLSDYEQTAFAHCRFIPQGGAPASDNFLLLAEPKDLNLGNPAFIEESEALPGGALRLTVNSEAFAPYVWIFAKDHTPLACSDNFFHLVPGQPRTITANWTTNSGRPVQVSDLVVRTFSSSIA